MRHPKIIIGGIALAAVAAVGSVTAAPAGGTSASSTRSASPAAAAATVHTVPASVGGTTETILVNAHGLPLYYYRPDTASKSLVTGSLAQLWPPLTAAVPTGSGLGGQLAVVNDVHGHQVSYHGHPLYTFAGDHPGQVAGQGVQDFFVATPGLAAIGTAPAAPSGGGLGY